MDTGNDTDRTVPRRERAIERQVRVLAEAIQQFATSLNLQSTLRSAIGTFVEQMNAEAGSLFLLDASNRELVCHQCAGPVDITGLSIPAHEGIVGRTVTTQATQIVRNVQTEKQFNAAVDAGTGFETRSILCSPLVVRGQSIGALELINKRTGDGQFDEEDRHLATALAAAAALAIHNARMVGKLVDQERVRKELELVREVQINLLPRQGAETMPVVAINIPAREVSGDFYDYFRLPDGRVYFNIADVSGKGMNTALWMAKATGLLHCLAKDVSDLARLLARVNEEVCETASHGMFVTLVTGIYDPVRDEVVLANAGHLPALYRSRDGVYQEIPAEGPPIGVVPDAEYRVARLSLDGGSLYLCTDGVTEAPDHHGNLLGISGLRALIDSVAQLSPRGRLEELVAALRRDGRGQRDDITLMLVEAQG
jgi:sigma-B regulation protein RsbU (phosphoserine phosphatase)